MTTLTARLDSIVTMDLDGRIDALLPLIEVLVPAWTRSGWGEDGEPVTSALAQLRRVANDEALDADALSTVASACLEHLGEMGEGVHNSDPAEPVVGAG